MNDTLTIESWEAQWEILSEPPAGQETALAARRALTSSLQLLALLGSCGVENDRVPERIALVPGNGLLIWDIENCVGNLAPALDLGAGAITWMDILRRPVAKLQLDEADAPHLLRMCISLGLDAAAEAVASLDTELVTAWKDVAALKIERYLSEYARWYGNAVRFLDSWHERAERVISHGLDPRGSSYSLIAVLARALNSDENDDFIVRIGLELPTDSLEWPLWFVEPVDDRRPDWLPQFPGARWRDGHRVRAELPASALTSAVGMRSQATALRGFVDHALRVFSTTPIS